MLSLVPQKKKRKGRFHRAPAVSDCPSNFDSEQVVPVAGSSIEDCIRREAEFLHSTCRFFEYTYLLTYLLHGAKSFLRS